MTPRRIAAALALLAMTVRLSPAQSGYASSFAPSPLPPGSAPDTQAKQFRLGHLTITGNTHTKLFVILRMILLSEGDIFNQSLWELGLEQINRSGLFELIEQTDVVMKPDDATGIVNIELHLREKHHQRVELSGGGGTTGGASLSLDYSNINLTGRGDRLAGQVRVGTRERSGNANYAFMLYRRLPVSFDLSGFFERLEFVNAGTLQQTREPLFIQRTGGGSIGAFLPVSRSRYTIGAATRVGLIYSVTSSNLADALLLTTVPVRSLEQGGLRTASLTPMLLHDTLDRVLDPRRGERLVVGAEVGARVLGGSLDTFKPYADFRRFWSLKGKDDSSREPITFGIRMRASNIRAFGGLFDERALSTVRGVPVFRRVFIGGETEVRGYDVNSIAPLARVDRFIVTNGNVSTLASTEVRPIGGDTQMIFNAEYRVPIIWRLSTAAFFDIGAAFDARRLIKEIFETATQVQQTGAPVTVLTVLKPLKAGQDFLPRYRSSLGGELRFPIPVLNIPLRLIFSWNPNAQNVVPIGTLLVPEKRFAFRVGFTRTL